MAEIPYQTEPLSLAGAVGAEIRNVKLAGQVLSLAIFSATFQDDVMISTNGQSFFPLSFSDSLSFREPTDVWIGNRNAGTNAIVIANGSARISRSFSAGGAVIISGTAATSIADGADVALGARADAAAATDTATATLIALAKRLLGKLPSPADLVSGASAACVGVNGEATILAAPGAGLKNHASGLLASNASATPSAFEIRDGAAGTVLFSGYLAANAVVAISLPAALRQPTANTALVVRQLAAGSVQVSATGYKGA